MKRRWSLLFVGLVFCWCADTQAGASPHYAVNSDKSKLPISVCKEGLFKLFGPDHLVSADIISGHGLFKERMLESSSIDLAVNTNSLAVIDPR
jgi:hypothetical protein